MGEEIKGVGVTPNLKEEEDEKKDNIIGEHKAMMEMFKKVALFETAFKLIFGNSAHISTKKVSFGGTSGQIFVPKRFHKKSATVIIWDEDRFYE